MLDPTLLLFGQLLLATTLGVIMGAERSIVARRQAGMRTYGLVALGACAFVLGGTSIGTSFLGIAEFDPTRIAAAIVQGVGFIGAGLIFIQRDNVHGITTAAGLWVSASVGVLVAFGLYSVAIFATALTLIVFFALWYLEQALKRWHGDK